MTRVLVFSRSLFIEEIVSSVIPICTIEPRTLLNNEYLQRENAPFENRRTVVLEKT